MPNISVMLQGSKAFALQHVSEPTKVCWTLLTIYITAGMHGRQVPKQKWQCVVHSQVTTTLLCGAVQQDLPQCTTSFISHSLLPHLWSQMLCHFSTIYCQRTVLKSKSKTKELGETQSGNIGCIIRSDTCKTWYPRQDHTKILLKAVAAQLQY